MMGITLGVVMVALGLFVAMRPLWTHNGVLTEARWLDMMIAGVFMFRGVMHVRFALARRALAHG
jgi:uncharacterized membrane protein HdeD (DUF308 family)